MTTNSELQDLIEQRRQQREQLRDESGRFYKKTVKDYVDEYGLDKSDTRVLNLLAQQEDIENPEREVTRLIRNTKMPTDADKPSSVARGVSFASPIERLRSEYNAKVAKARNANEVIRLKMEYRRRGLKDLY